MQMAHSTSSKTDVFEDYPCPTHVNVAYFVPVKLSGKKNYNAWKTQMLCLFVSHGMLGFIDGTVVRPTMMNRVQSSTFGKKKAGESIKAKNNKMEMWTRSDALAKGWIIGSLNEEVVEHVVDLLATESELRIVAAATDFTAKQVWDKLQFVYSPITPTYFQQDSKGKEITEVAESRMQRDSIPVEEEDKAKKEADARARIQQLLYYYTLKGDRFAVDNILYDRIVTVTDKISINGNTALHVAIGTGKETDFIKSLLHRTPAYTLLGLRNSEGSTVLHVAAIVGNIEAAKLLVDINSDLLYVEDDEGCIPLARALSNMHIDMFLYLMDVTRPDVEKGSLFAGESGDELLVNTISSKSYKAAWELVKSSFTLKSTAPLMAIAQNFPRKPTFWERKIYPWVELYRAIRYFEWNWVDIGDLSRIKDYVNISDLLCTCCLGPILMVLILVVLGLYMVFGRALEALGSQIMQLENKDELKDQARRLLCFMCNEIKDSNDSSSHHVFYTDPILEAAKLNAHEVVEVVVSMFPNAIWCINEDGHNIIQVAVINRSEDVYNLLYQMSEHKNTYKTIQDSFGNNLLHLAGRLAPPNKLNLISGAALQIQRELQWFQEVKGFVCPLNVMQKNDSNETPQMVFTREHKGLVIEGEKWMKATAESYTITAALIITIVFAAAITVPGGNNQDTGIPVFTNNVGFTIFAISDAVSLFTSTTSLLMFLSILTARFAEQDFLFVLPTKLVIGLITLFISTTAMLVAFSTTLFLVFGQQRAWILVPIAALTCLPITSFVTLQYPLIADLIRSTYGRRIFGRKQDHPFY